MSIFCGFYLPYRSQMSRNTFSINKKLCVPCRRCVLGPFMIWIRMRFETLYRGVRLKPPLNSETRFLGKRGTIFWKYFQMFEIFWAGYYFLRSPPKMAKIFWRFAPKHIDFAFKYGPKMPKIFRRFAPRIFSPRGPIFCKNFQFFRAGYYFLQNFLNVANFLSAGY